MAGRKPVDSEYWKTLQDLKALLEMPLPGGRGFQRQRFQQIHYLCGQLAEYALPDL